MTDAGVIGRKTAEGQRRESMTDCVEPIHAGEPQRHDARRCQSGIYRPQQLGGLPDARRELAVLHRSGHLGAVNLHAAHAQHRQDGHGQHDDAHAAEPAQQVAPQIDRARQVFEARKHRAAGGGQARGGLEVGIGKIDGQEMPQRETGDRGQRDPGQRHQHQAVPGLEFALEAPRRQPQQRADQEGRECGDDERPECRIQAPDRHDQGREHGHGKYHHDEGKDVRNRQ